MKKYEVIFIVKVLEENIIEENIVKFQQLLQNNNAEVLDINRWGKRRLAYEIEKQKEGFYVLITFSTESKTVFELERVLKITDDILKYIIIKLDK